MAKKHKAPIPKKQRGRPRKRSLPPSVSEQVLQIFRASGLSIMRLQELTRTVQSKEATGVPYQTLWRWTNRKTSCSATTQDRICRALRVAVVQCEMTELKLIPGTKRRKRLHGRVHKCSVCGRLDHWETTWSWYGSWCDLDNENITKFCSDECKQTANLDRAQGLVTWSRSTVLNTTPPARPGREGNND